MAKKEKAKEEGVTEENAKTAGKTDEAGAEGEGAPKKKSKKKLFILIGLVVILLGGGGGAFMVLKGGGSGHQEEVKVEAAVYYSMPQMLINLSASGKQASFLKANIILELPRALDAVTVEANLPRLMDAFNTYVRELRPSDLAGSAGIARLREELVLRANKALDPVKVNDVLFKEIVVQ